MHILFLVLVVMLSAIPLNHVIPWLQQQYHSIDEQLERPQTFLVLPKHGFIWMLKIVLIFLKGFLSIHIAKLYFPDDSLILISAGVLALCSHTWPFWTKFSQNKQSMLVLWGIYTALFWPSSFLFPLISAVLILLFNSIHIGLLLTTVCQLLMMGVLPLPLEYLPLNFMLFIITLIAIYKPLFQHLESGKHTLLKSFRNR